MMETPYFAETDLVIRKPVAEVFNAFIDPEITKNFWYTHSSGKMKEGANLIWTWEMYQLKIPVYIEKIIASKQIVITWGEAPNASTVTWTFHALTQVVTHVTIRNDGFSGSPSEQIHQLRDSTGGFTFVLSGLKAYLEHGINLNLIADKFPPELQGKK